MFKYRNHKQTFSVMQFWLMTSNNYTWRTANKEVWNKEVWKPRRLTSTTEKGDASLKTDLEALLLNASSCSPSALFYSTDERFMLAFENAQSIKCYTNQRKFHVVQRQHNCIQLRPSSMTLTMIWWHMHITGCNNYLKQEHRRLTFKLDPKQSIMSACSAARAALFQLYGAL